MKTLSAQYSSGSCSTHLEAASVIFAIDWREAGDYGYSDQGGILPFFLFLCHDVLDEYDVNGTKRILQVIHAHTWPNLVMKGMR